MKRILVPTDFSEQAEQALKAAVSLAKKYDAKIYLLHMVELPLHLANANTGALPESLFFMKLAHKKFEDFMNKPYLKDINIEQVVESEEALFGISNAVKKHEIDLIVMGSSGASGLKEIFVGSNTEKVVRTAEVPVLVIKEKTDKLDIKNIVYACDFSAESLNSFTKATSFAKALEAKLHLLYVNTPNFFQTTAKTEEKIQNFIEKTGTTDYTLNIYNDVSIEQGILNFTENIDADLIAMSTHGRKGIAHFFNGSISEDLVNHAIKPVITFKI